jgi:hypothetical protein
MPILAHKVKTKDLLPDLQRGGGGQKYGGLNEGIAEEIKIPHHVYQRVKPAAADPHFLPLGGCPIFNGTRSE